MPGPEVNVEETIPVIFDRQCKKYGDRVAIHQRTPEGWVDYSWNQYRADVRDLANGLISLGLVKGEKVSILSINRYEWVVSDYAVMSAGGVSVPIYVTARAQQIEYVVDHSESKFFVVENQAQFDRVGYVSGKLENLKNIIVIEPVETDDERVLTLEQVKEMGRKYTEQNPGELDRRIEEVKPEELMSIMYTSGTTGPPKGVMLSHYNAVWTVGALNKCFDFEEGERIVSYLPLSHIAERNITCFQSVINGYNMYFGMGLDTLREDLTETRPTIMFGVPRVWQKFNEALQKRFEEETGLKKKLINWSLGVGKETTSREQAHQSLGLGLRMKHGLADHLVFSKIREGVGLDKLRIVVSGAAPIEREVLEFFHAIGIPIREVYGQTEDTGPTSIHQYDKIKMGTVGEPLPGEEVKIAEDGEILVKGGNVFQGYYKEPEATAETLVDGWLYSGDVGNLDEDGFLTITDRKKDLIITAGGKNLAPQVIEIVLSAGKYIGQAVVIGDRRKFLTALITLNPETIPEWAKKQGIEYADVSELIDNEKVIELIRSEVEKANDQLSRVETIKDFRILPKEFTIEDGFLTPTLKVRRSQVMGQFKDTIDKMYADLGA